MKRRLFAVLLVITLGVSAGCASQRVTLQERYEQGLKPFTRLGLEECGLVPVWEQDLSQGPSEKKVKIEIADAYLYEKTILIVTVDNLIWAFDRQSGDPQWVTQLARPLKFQPAYFAGKFYCVCGGQLFTIDNRGAVTPGASFPFSVSKPLFVTEDYIYAVSSDGMLHKVDKTKLTDIWKSSAKTENVICDTPILLEGMFIYGTMQGQVLGVDRIVGGRRLELKGLGAIAGGIVTDGQLLYFGSADYHLYCYTNIGAPVWKLSAEGVIALPPVLAGDTLYVELFDDGLLAASRRDGAVIWRNPDARSFVASDASKVFAVAGTERLRELWVLDAATGTPTAQVDAREFSIVPRNLAGDGAAFLVSKSGRIVCLRAR